MPSIMLRNSKGGNSTMKRVVNIINNLKKSDKDPTRRRWQRSDLISGSTNFTILSYI